MMEAIFNVLETMFFQVVQFSDAPCVLKEWFGGVEMLTGAQLTFDGPFCGAFFLFMTPIKADEIAADFLGLPIDQIDRPKRADTVKEALNMIGGNLLAKLDKAGDFRLGIPALLGDGTVSAETLDDRSFHLICFETDGAPMAAALDLQ